MPGASFASRAISAGASRMVCVSDEAMRTVRSTFAGSKVGGWKTAFT